jgi:molybdopterin molybdotransferase
VVDVVRLPTVAILASGDELRDVGSPYTDAHVINSNAWAIAAACRRLGCSVRMLGIAADTLADHVDKMAVDDVDVLITIGGVSMGSHDFVRPALEALGASLSVWKLAMRPGKPLAFATLPRARRPVLVFGLPGNPVSSLVTFEVFVQPALRVLAGASRGEVDGPRERGVLVDAAPFTKKRGLAFFARAKHHRRADGVVEVQTVNRQGSGQVSGLADASALVCFGVDDEVVNPGSTVEFIALA